MLRDEQALKSRDAGRRDGQDKRSPEKRDAKNDGRGTNGSTTADRTTAESLQEYGRGVAGGLLFSLPLLYTMEMWWAGFSMSPWRLLAGLLATFILLLGYNRYAGLRRDASFTEVAIDSVEELGIGLLIATVVLWLLGRISFDMSVYEIIGQIVLESLPIAIGVSVGTAQLSGGQPDSGESESGGMQGDSDKPNFVGQIVLAFCGAILIAGNIAPTEEITMLAVELSTGRLIGLVVVSLLLSALILFYSGFRGARQIAPADGILTTLISSILTYAIALVAAALILWFFGSFDGFAPATWLAQTIVLGVAATLGASAGRLLLQTNTGT